MLDTLEWLLDLPEHFTDKQRLIISAFLFAIAVALFAWNAMTSNGMPL